MKKSWDVLRILSPEPPARSFLVRWRGRECVLRRPGPDGVDLATQAAVMAWAAGQGLPVPPVLAAGPAYLLLGLLPGEPGGPWAGADLGEARIGQAFGLLGRLHAAGAAQPPAIDLPRDSWRFYLPAAALPADSAVPGPRVLCHGDFHPANLLFAGDDVTGLVDFEYAQWSWAAYDLAYGLLTCCGDWGGGRLVPAKRDAALAAYGQAHPWDAAALAVCFPLAIQAVSAWLRALPRGGGEHPSGEPYLSRLLAERPWRSLLGDSKYP
jgi:Ser/Thr protein kinase RdoA (MazF antagonist)